MAQPQLPIYADYNNRLNPACYTQGRDGGHPVLLGVRHNTEGPNDDNSIKDPALAQRLSDQAAAYLASNDRQVSIHWLIGAEACGAPIYRIVPTTSIAYHAGGNPGLGYPASWTNPDTGITYRNYGINQISEGWELFGHHTDIVGPNQTRSIKLLMAYELALYPILAQPGHTVSHKKLEGDRQDGPNWEAITDQCVADFLKGSTTLDNNPNKYNIGQGFLQELAKRGHVALTNEQFYSPDAGQTLEKRSFMWAKDPVTSRTYIYLYFAGEGVVRVVQEI